MKEAHLKTWEETLQQREADLDWKEAEDLARSLLREKVAKSSGSCYTCAMETWESKTDMSIYCNITLFLCAGIEENDLYQGKYQMVSNSFHKKRNR